jgi:hypothetical protein
MTVDSGSEAGYTFAQAHKSCNKSNNNNNRESFMSGWYANIGSAKVQKTGQYFKPGQYRVKILAVKEVTGQLNKNYTVIETRVLESDNPEIPVGSEKSQVIEMGNVMALSNIKAFMAAVSGVDATLDNVNTLVEEYWHKVNPDGVFLSFDKIMDEMVIKANALSDVELGLTCTEIKKRDGSPFTKYIWEVRQD